ncbi:hypothetical protein ABT336_16920 [Micromonospora sp. NPDC000207]|uniref:hypothetical protein n=1 Tax=Micromonospora sp. NPDC000207 TaxID=3154246 RepID=UPI00331ACC7B
MPRQHDLTLEEVTGNVAPETKTHYVDTMGDAANSLVENHDVQRLVYALRQASDSLNWRLAVKKSALDYQGFHDPEFDGSLHFTQPAFADRKGRMLADPYANSGHIVAPHEQTSSDERGRQQTTVQVGHYLTDAGLANMRDREKSLKDAGIGKNKEEREEFDKAKAWRLGTSDKDIRKAADDVRKIQTGLDTLVKEVSNSHFKALRQEEERTNAASMRDPSFQAQHGRGDNGQGSSRRHHHRSDQHRQSGRSHRQ